MNLIEERIRAAARAAADTVSPDSVPALELPAARAQRLSRRRRNGRSPGVTWTRWAARLAPAAAALAVSAILITIVTVSPPTHQGGPDPAGSTAGRPGTRPAVPAGPPVSSYVRSGQVPPYYLTATSAGAAVRLTVSGATVATITPSQPGGKVAAVTATGDDRTFVLAEAGRGPEVSFYRVRLGSSGRPSAPARLPVTVTDSKALTGLALSPDGTRLALAPGDGVQQVRLYPLRGGPARTWSATGGTISAALSTTALSWPASQHTLAFAWAVGQTASVRLLDLGSAGGSLLAASRPAVTLGNTARMGQTLYQCGPLIITPDGSAIVCASSTITVLPMNRPIVYRTGFPEFSVVTGRVVRVVGNWPVNRQYQPSVEDLLWSSPSGRVLIGTIRSAGDRLWTGVISGNEFTPLNVRPDPASFDTGAFGTW